MAIAAPASAASFGIEATTDLRRRGLSWSNGEAALEAWGSLPIRAGFSVEAGAATLRGSPRGGGADLLVEAALRYSLQTGPWALWTEVQGIGFVGAPAQYDLPLDYGQLRAGAAFGFGPARLSAQIGWAPPQQAIGGSNIYIAGRASIGVPGTPLTLGAGVGRSVGSDDGSGRSNRLRPGGDYTDVRFDADYGLGPVILGASVTATSIDGACAAACGTDHGTRFLLRASIGF